MSPNCKQCQQPLPADAPEGLCPACLARVALGIEPGTPATIDVNPMAEAAADVSELSIGQVRYFGDYELLEEIARGGMGVVYKARQASLNRVVAVKMILAGQLASEAEVKRFRTEAEAAAQLQHPNIVAIHEVGEHQGQNYFSMDFVAGMSLAARLGDEPLAIGEAARLMKTIAEAVHFAHGRGVVHRDLKPANVLLDEFGQPRITDFGLAKRLDRGDQLTASGAMLGTPDYMSPEQAAGRHDLIGPAGDVFSLGAMLYEMITGGVPFRGSNLAETLSHIIHDEPAPPSRLNPRVPPDLETICLACLEKRPDRRYATAGALARDLGRFLNHEAISARALGTPRKVSRWLMSHAQILAALVSVAMLALVWLGYGLWTENRVLAWEVKHPTEMKLSTESNIPIQWPKTTRFRGLAIFLVFFTLAVQFELSKRTRRRVLTGRFISPRVLAAFGLVGLAGATWGVYLGAAGIETWLWAGHNLPIAQTAMAAGRAAKANLDKLSESSREWIQKNLEQTKLVSKLTQRFPELATNKILFQNAITEAVIESTKMAQISSNMLQIVTQETAAQQKWLELMPSFNLLQLQVKSLEEDDSVAALVFLLFFATIAVWRNAALVLNASREHRFAFYPSAEAEEAALSHASMEQRMAAEQERRSLKNARRTILVFSIGIFVFPYFYCASDEQISTKLVFVLGAASAFALAWIASLLSWRGSSRWNALNRVLLVVSALGSVAALLRGPVSLMERGILFGAVDGAVLGLFLRWLNTKDVEVPKPDGDAQRE